MPSDRARKDAVRSEQLPGESYTSALRRLAAPAGWTLDGQGCGSTEFTGNLAGRDMVVTFVGDHRAPWVGWWQLMDAEDLCVALAEGRVRFTTTPPPAAEVTAALGHISSLWSQIRAGGSPDTVSTEHGRALTGADVVDGGTYFVSWSAEDWAVATFEDLSDASGSTWRLDMPSADSGIDLLTVDEAGAWSDGVGRSVAVYAL